MDGVIDFTQPRSSVRSPIARDVCVLRIQTHGVAGVGELGQTAVPLHRYAHFRRDLHLGRATIASMLQMDSGGVPVADESPHGTWQRIEAAEIVEHGAADSMVGQRLEFDVSATIIPVGRFDQTCDAC